MLGGAVLCVDRGQEDLLDEFDVCVLKEAEHLQSLSVEVRPSLCR